MRRTTSLAIAVMMAVGIACSSGTPALAAGIAGATAETAAGTSASDPNTAPDATPAPDARPAPDATRAPDATPAPDAAPAPSSPPPSTSTSPAPSDSPATTAPAAPQFDARAATATSQSVIEPFTPGTTRVFGDDRYATAAQISKRYAAGVPVLYLATGLDYPDALASAAAASAKGGPLLLTLPDVLPEVVRAEIKRLAPARIVIAGSEASVWKTVEDDLATLVPKAVVERQGGSDRFETAEKLNAGAFTWADQAFIATGRGFADALAASAAAGSQSSPVFLVDGLASSARSETIAALKALEVRSVRIAGSSASVSAGIESQLKGAGFTVYRDQGPDRFATAAAINDAVFGGRSSLQNMFIATGAGFADALAGAALAGRLGSPLYLVRQECLPQSAARSMAGMPAESRVVLGGTPSVGNSTIAGNECIEWVRPAAGRITDVFGPRTPICTPAGCTSAFHRGTDIGTGCGRPVYAASSGIITYAGVLGTFGNWVRVAHGRGEETGYAHLQSFSVRSGEAVTTGQQIGLSGTTGASTGCHLHFEVYVNGTQVDPVPFMSQRGAPLG
jgi:murein DD-endopeptidase MepM/ murein hydrolase activator NlpD